MDNFTYDKYKSNFIDKEQSKIDKPSAYTSKADPFHDYTYDQKSNFHKNHDDLYRYSTYDATNNNYTAYNKNVYGYREYKNENEEKRSDDVNVVDKFEKSHERDD